MAACLRGREMLMDLKRSDFLPPWDEDGVRTVTMEINTFYDKMITRRTGGGPSSHDDDDEDAVIVNNAYYGLCMLRDRRYLSSYVIHRLRKASSLYWEVGNILPEAIHRDILSQKESDFYNEFCDMMNEYNDAIGLDLRADLEPPKELFIEVRVVIDCGEIQTENGPVNLEKDTTHFLRRSDVEMLVLEGKLVYVD